MSLLDQLVNALQNGNLKIIDLTASLAPDTPVIGLPEPLANTPGFDIHEISRYDERGPAWYWNWFSTGEHVGTHFDAPVHWISGKDLPNNTTDTIPPQKFIGPACVIDVTQEAEANPDFLMTPEHIKAWEEKHGRIPPRSWVLMRTGWSKRTDPKDFLNAGPDGAHTPGWSKECAEFLAKERDVLGVGVEQVGTDAGQAFRFNPPFCNHSIMHGNGKFGLTQLINLDKLPPTGAVLIAAPLKIVDGSGSPVRAIAIIE